MKENKVYFNIVMTIVVSYILIKFIDSYKYFIDTFRVLISLLTPFIIAFIISYILNPIVMFLEQKLSINRFLALCLTYSMILTVVISSILFTMPTVINNVSDIIDSMPHFANQTQDFIIKTTNQMQNFDSNEIKNLFDKFMVELPDLSRFFVGYLGEIFSTTFSIGKFIVHFILAFVIAFYILLEKESFISFMKKLNYIAFGKKYGDFTLEIISTLNTNIGKYFAGKVFDSIIVGILSGIGLSLIGSKYSLLFGLLMCFMNMIPYFGPAIGMTPVVIINLFYSPSVALFSLGYLLLVQQIEVIIIEPKIVGGQLGLSAFFTILAVTVGGGFFGLPGMILSVPIMGVIKVYIEKFVEFKYSHFENSKS